MMLNVEAEAFSLFLCGLVLVLVHFECVEVPIIWTVTAAGATDS